MTLKRMIELLKEYLRMNNISVADTNALHLELTDTAGASVNNYRLNQIDKIKDYFNNEINERKDIIKNYQV